MQRAVEFAVAASVEPVADRLAGGGGDRGGAGEACEGGFGGDASWCDQERTSWAAACGPTPGWSSSCGASLRVSVSISRASSRSSAVRCQDASGDRAQCEQAAAQLGVVSTVRSCCGEALQEPCSCQRPQLAAQRLRVVISRSRSWQSPARLALTAPSRAATSACNAWRSPPARGVAGRCSASTLRAARTASSASVLPPERRSRRSRLTSSTRSPGRSGSGSDRHRKSQCLRPRTRADRRVLARRASAPVRSRRCSRRPSTRTRPRRSHVHDGERVRVAVRVDTDDVVQLICKHPLIDLQPKRWGTRTGVGLGWKPRAAEL